MEQLIIYELKVAAGIAVFYSFYRLLLSKETLHRLSRVVLISTAVLSFVLPLCVITFNVDVVVPHTHATESFMPEAAVLDAAPREAISAWWWTALAMIYTAGVLATLAKTLISVLGVYRLIRDGKTVYMEDGLKLAVVERKIAPCSWMHTIILSREDYEENCTGIILHESAHIDLGHSKDVLLVDLLTAFQWFNPMMWMLRSDLRAVHEFEADDAVLSKGVNIREYSHLLIRKAIGGSGYSVTNSFNHSILKNRITMMSRTKTKLTKGLRAFYILPLVCISLALSAEEKVNYIHSGDYNDTIKINADETIVRDTVRISQDTAELGELPPLFIQCKASDVVNDKDSEFAIKGGKILTDGEFNSISVEDIAKIRVYKDSEHIRMYKEMFGYDKPVSGVLIIVMADQEPFTKDS